MNVFNDFGRRVVIRALLARYNNNLIFTLWVSCFASDFAPGVSGGTRPCAPRSLGMLKVAAVLLVLMILFGILGFVVNVAGAITKVAFFVCLVALGVSLAMKALKRSA